MPIRPAAGRALIRLRPVMEGKLAKGFVAPLDVDRWRHTHRMDSGLADVLAVADGEWRYSRRLKREVREPVFVRAGDCVVIDNILLGRPGKGTGNWVDVSAYFDDGAGYYLALSRQLLAVTEAA